MKTSHLSPRAKTITLLGLAGWLLTACAQMPSSYVMLMSNDDGTVGKIEVRADQEKIVLDKVHHATSLTADAGQIFTPDLVQVHEDFHQALAARPEKPVSFILYFEIGTTQLTAASELEMSHILGEINRRSVPDISVVGHTDTAGDLTQNEQLGLERAKFISSLLHSPKLNADNVSVMSFGKRTPLVPTADNVAEALNRRVEVTVR